jgi:DnaJ-class molecular chaperone
MSGQKLQDRPGLSDDDLFGLCEMIGDTYAHALMQDCPECKGTGVNQEKPEMKHLLIALMRDAGARTSMDIPGDCCRHCGGDKKVKNEKHATEAAMRAAREHYADIVGEAK